MSEIKSPSHWKVTQLENIATLQRGKDLPVDKREQGSYPVVGSNGIVGYHLEFVAHGPGVVVGRSGSVGKVTWVESNYWPLNTALWVKDFHGNEPLFISYFLDYLDLGKYTGGVSVPTLNRNVVHPLQVAVPSVPEQKAIAHTLRTIQKAKEARQRELDLERERKAALMQYLFTYGTRNEPRKQTKIGEIPESWDVVPVGKICNSIVPGRNKPKRFDGTIPWITIPDIRGKTKVEASLSGLAVSREAVAEAGGRIIPTGSVIMSCVGNFGIASIAGCDLVINQQLHAFICPENLDAYFLSHALQKQKSYMEGIALVTVVPYLNKDKCNSVPIPLPSFDEQKQITEIISACDAKLTALEKEISTLDELFRAMLEKLMTGRLSALPLVELKV